MGGKNRPCRKAPETKEFCADHYWYGPNKCDKAYCRVTDEQYLQWQCKKTCGLCNTDPSQKEMDKICNAYLGPEVRAKYKSKSKVPSKSKNKQISKTKNKKEEVSKQNKRPKKTKQETP